MFSSDEKKDDDDGAEEKKTKKKKRKYFSEEEVSNLLRQRVTAFKSNTKLIPMPYIPRDGEEARQNCMIAGPENSGKSTLAAMYINQFQHLFPGRKVFVISKITKDAKIDALKPVRIKLDDALKAAPIKLEEISNSLVLFDDVEHIADPDMQKSVETTRKVAQTDGRHHNIYVISVVHDMMAGIKTKTTLSESGLIFLFPGCGDTYHMKKVLKEYCGCDTALTKRILSVKSESGTPSRWVCISKRSPRLVYHEYGAFIIQ